MRLAAVASTPWSSKGVPSRGNSYSNRGSGCTSCPVRKVHSTSLAVRESPSVLQCTLAVVALGTTGGNYAIVSKLEHHNGRGFSKTERNSQGERQLAGFSLISPAVRTCPGAGTTYTSSSLRVPPCHLIIRSSEPEPDNGGREGNRMAGAVNSGDALIPGEEAVRESEYVYGQDEANSSVYMPQKTRVQFTCKRCDATTVREVSLVGLFRGTVFVQCGGCKLFHQLVDNLQLIEEVHFAKDDDKPQ